MLEKYHNIEYILDADFMLASDLFYKYFEDRKEQRNWEYYIALVPNFDKDNYMSYSEFLGKSSPKKISNSNHQNNELEYPESIVNSKMSDEKKKRIYELAEKTKTMQKIKVNVDKSGVSLSNIL